MKKFSLSPFPSYKETNRTDTCKPPSPSGLFQDLRLSPPPPELVEDQVLSFVLQGKRRNLHTVISKVSMEVGYSNKGRGEGKAAGGYWGRLA